MNTLSKIKIQLNEYAYQYSIAVDGTPLYKSFEEYIDDDIQSEYRAEEIHCTNDAEDIYGVAYIPETNAEKYPLVIFSHELYNTHTSGISYAKVLAARGIAVYTFDYRNGSSASGSGNDMEKMSVMTEVSDLESVMNAAKTWDFVDGDRIVLIGGSQGGFVTAATAAKHTDEIAGHGFYGPAFDEAIIYIEDYFKHIGIL